MQVDASVASAERASSCIHCVLLHGELIVRFEVLYLLLKLLDLKIFSRLFKLLLVLYRLQIKLLRLAHFG